MVFSFLSTPSLPCEQWFLQAGRYAKKGEEPLRATVCFSIEHARPSDTYAVSSASGPTRVRPKACPKPETAFETPLAPRVVKWLSNLLHEPFFAPTFCKLNSIFCRRNKSKSLKFSASSLRCERLFTTE